MIVLVDIVLFGAATGMCLTRKDTDVEDRGEHLGSIQKMNVFM